MVAVLVPHEVAQHFFAVCQALKADPDLVLSFLAIEHSYVIDDDAGAYVRSFQVRASTEGTDRFDVSKKAFRVLVQRAYQLDATASDIAAAILWEHLDALEFSPEAYAGLSVLQGQASTKRRTVGVYLPLYRAFESLTKEVGAPSVRGLIYGVFKSVDIDDAVASLDTEDLFLFRKRYAGEKTYPVTVPPYAYDVLCALKRRYKMPLTTLASLILRHELDALRLKVTAQAPLEQSSLARWMAALEHLFLPEQEA